VLFLLARDAYWQIVTAMALDGFGVGCVYAVNPLQITGSVPAAETGSAMSFYQLARTVAYSIASALSATMLVLSIPRGHHLPTDAGYSTVALTSTIVLVAAPYRQPGVRPARRGGYSPPAVRRCSSSSSRRVMSSRRLPAGANIWTAFR
jgi:hypothetical protein